MIFDDVTRIYHLHHLEESASHPLPLLEGVPQVMENGAKHSPPGDRGPPDCLEGVPPVCVPGPL